MNFPYIKSSRKIGRRLVLEVTPKGCYRVFSKFGSCVINEGILWRKELCRSVVLVVFTGGTDISPSIYGENKGSYTSHSDSFRDNLETKVFYRAKSLGIPIVGICRGAQLLCALSGGRLAQHIAGHSRNHLIQTHEGKIIQVTSVHHQMQIPPKNANVLAYSVPKQISNFYLDGNDKQIEDVSGDVEVVHYPENKAIGIQFHPEYCSEGTDCFRYSQQIVDEFLMRKVEYAVS